MCHIPALHAQASRNTAAMADYIRRRVVPAGTSGAEEAVLATPSLVRDAKRLAADPL
jgi:hypothetical protein